MMTPEEKERINKLLKEAGGKYTVDELEFRQKRAIRTLGEWYSQSEESQETLPQEIQDIKMMARLATLMMMSGGFPLSSAFDTLEMSIEAAYNLGKAAPKT